MNFLMSLAQKTLGCEIACFVETECPLLVFVCCLSVTSLIFQKAIKD